MRITDTGRDYAACDRSHDWSLSAPIHQKFPNQKETRWSWWILGMLMRRGLPPSLPGEDHVEVYHSAFTPLEWQLNPERPQNACYVKVCLARRLSVLSVRLRRTYSCFEEVSNGI